MPRYFARPIRPKVGSDWSDDIPRPSTLDACDHEATDTGLLDQHGNAIWRGPNPMGFIWDEIE